MILGEYLQGGVSKQRHRKISLDRHQVLKKHFGWLHLIIVARALAKS
ncbi:MAG: hypothetical protein AAB316_07760 [Bacteroidota bacterium]